MPVELQIIRASEFICLDADELLDFEASKQLLRGLAFACRKRGLDRAMLDLRSVPMPAKPHYTLEQLALLIGTFREAGFTRKQRLAVLYAHDVHGGVRNFAFFGKMRGLQVQAFHEFERAVYWLAEGLESPAESQSGTPIPISKRETKKSAGERGSSRCGSAAKGPPIDERKAFINVKRRLTGIILLGASIFAIHAQTPASALAQPSEAFAQSQKSVMNADSDALPGTANPLLLASSGQSLAKTNTEK